MMMMMIFQNNYNNNKFPCFDSSSNDSKLRTRSSSLDHHCLVPTPFLQPPVCRQTTNARRVRRQPLYLGPPPNYPLSLPKSYHGPLRRFSSIPPTPILPQRDPPPLIATTQR
uniref:Uncharacterized protein n=1 Tax=Opuntia streptacantha TaxID=393608 RepID=A0A7C9D857_OPUST